MAAGLSAGLTIEPGVGEKDTLRALHGMMEDAVFWRPEVLSQASPEAVDAYIHDLLAEAKVGKSILESLVEMRSLPVMERIEAWSDREQTKAGSLHRFFIDKDRNLRRAAAYATGLPLELLGRWYGKGTSRSLEAETSILWLPDDLHVPGSLSLNHCEHLGGLPNRLEVRGALRISSCARLKSLPDDLKVRDEIMAAGCESLSSIPKAMVVGGILDLRRSGMVRVPAVQTTFDLKLDESPFLEELDPRIVVGSSLWVRECPRLKRIASVQVRSNLWMEGTPATVEDPSRIEGRIIR